MWRLRIFPSLTFRSPCCYCESSRRSLSFTEAEILRKQKMFRRLNATTEQSHDKMLASAFRLNNESHAASQMFQRSLIIGFPSPSYRFSPQHLMMSRRSYIDEGFCIKILIAFAIQTPERFTHREWLWGWDASPLYVALPLSLSFLRNAIHKNANWTVIPIYSDSACSKVFLLER